VPIGPDGFTPPTIKVAVVYSQTTLDWANKRGTPSRYPHAGKEGALLYYLKGRGYDVTQIVGDRDLKDINTLKQYDVVVLNSAYGMGTVAAQTLAAYVAGGGGLVSTIGSPRVNPAYAPPKGKTDHLNEWWWRVLKEHTFLHYWEWGPLSATYSEQFVNDGAYTPDFTLKPNPSSPIITQTQAILSARGYSDALSGVTLRHTANIEMAQKLPGTSDATSAADFNILTKSIKKLYPKTYSAIMASNYGSGRTVKFDYGATDFLRDYSKPYYEPLTPTGIHQGEVAGALVEAAIIWAATPDGSVAHSIDGTTSAVVSAGSSKVTIKQTVTNRGNTETRPTVRFTLYSPSGKTLQSWVTGGFELFPHQSASYAHTYAHGLPSGTCKAVATFTYGYPAKNVVATSQTPITRGQTLTTH
jgi:hypothetical protein